MAKNLLNALTKELPSFEEITLILSQIKSSSDLAAAITGTAIIEAALEESLKGRFKTDKNDLIVKIFENGGPLSSFDAKISIAEALGVISPKVAAELHTIRKLRNAFAHAKKILTFNEPVIATKLMNMGMIEAVNNATGDGDNKFVLDNRGWFLLVVQLLLVLIVVGNKEVSPVLQQIFADLSKPRSPN